MTDDRIFWSSILIVTVLICVLIYFSMKNSIFSSKSDKPEPEPEPELEVVEEEAVEPSEEEESSEEETNTEEVEIQAANLVNGESALFN